MLTLTERERLAYINGETILANFIHQTEEECSGVISPEHESVIDDRNRLRDALTECVEQMTDATEQVEACPYHARDCEGDATGDKPLELAPAFHDAVEAASQALGQCDEQYDDTIADKLRAAEKARDDALARLKLADSDGVKWRTLRDAVRRAVSPYARRAYIGDYNPTERKAAPKWAAYLIADLIRLEQP